MSAFQISDEQMSVIVQAVYGSDHRGFNIWRYLDDKEPTQEQFSIRQTAQQEANLLMAENVRSVQFRYKHHKDVSQAPYKGKVKLKFDAEPVSVLQALKFIDCLAYQSCETDDWESTEAYKLLCKYREKLINKLPGWNDAKWSI